MARQMRDQCFEHDQMLVLPIACHLSPYKCGGQTISYPLVQAEINNLLLHSNTFGFEARSLDIEPNVTQKSLLSGSTIEAPNDNFW